MNIKIQTDSICDKRFNLIDAIVGVAMGMGYCPGVFGWETNPSLSQNDCDSDNCIRCWNYAKAKALADHE